MTPVDPLESFHPAVAAWFRQRFPGGPTEAQARGWRSIAQGDDTLIAAPTGSGKTLAAFLVAIDRCFRAAGATDGPGGPDGARTGTSVLYVSPLKALTVDVRENLEEPLTEILAIASSLGMELPAVRVAVRNGDTPPSARAAMVRDRPEIVVTTPESLYLLLTSARGRALLSNVETVIVDEIHALARDKRGSHLALTLERLDRCVLQGPGGGAGAEAEAEAEAGGSGASRPGDAPLRRRPVRIGCSATQRPIATVARLLVGAGPGRDAPGGGPRCHIVDVGHRRKMDLAIELASGELGAVMATEQLADIVTRLAEEIAAHHTTLVFVNTRRMAERVAHLLGEVLAEELGEDVVAAHHGSLSTARRLAVESRLRSGELRAVVATASLELGIDVGPIDLVCQVASPRSIATFLQRVGRADHRLDGVPKGRLFPLTRDELVECVALLGAVHAGALDAVHPPVAPLDILAQQLVAETAAAGDEGIAESELAALTRRAAPFAAITAEDLESVIALVSEGVTTGRGVRGAHLARDRVNGVLRPRRGARLTALTSGGAIPELADFKVVAEPDDVTVGSVHEDFAVEAMVGDVFLLGSTPWQIRRVEQGVVRVVDAEGSPPTLPFWLGEAPSRTAELSEAVSDLRVLVAEALGTGGPGAARVAVAGWAQVTSEVAGEIVAYLGAALAELGELPTTRRLVFERFFDDTGGMQLVIHSPHGARVNRGLGLALRKRFCRAFDFELQAAANDDAVVLSLGPQHSFPLEEVTRYLSTSTVKGVLIQALLPTPIFTSRWRWNLGRSLLSPRYRGTRHLPPAIQRMEADDLMAAIFPALAACQENVTGPVEIPEHPIVDQTLADCCSEAIDLDALVTLVAGLADGSVSALCVDTSEPSLLAHEILNGRPYTFLDDAPLEERRTRAVTLRRGLPLAAYDLTALDPLALAEVAEEARPSPRDAEELHDLLMSLVVVAPDPEWEPLQEALVAAGRAMSVVARDGAPELWGATERRREIEALFPGAAMRPDHRLPDRLAASPLPTRADATTLAVGGRLETTGPVSPATLADLGVDWGGRGGGGSGGLEPPLVEAALLHLENRGSALRVGADLWCSRRLLARIHARGRERQTQRQPPVSTQTLMRFLLRWQHLAEGTRLVGASGLLEALHQLQGYEVAVGALEEDVLPGRIMGYHGALLDELCARGEVAWGRLGLRPVDPAGSADALLAPGRRGKATPSRATPVTVALREDLPWLLAAARGEASPPEPGPGACAEVLGELRGRGALFFGDLCEATGRFPAEIAEALWDGVARGWLTADTFVAVRSLLAGRYGSADRRPHRPGPATSRARRASWPGHTAPRPGPQPAGRPPGSLGRRPQVPLRPAMTGGRWSVLEQAAPSRYPPDELAEAVAWQLLARWGIVFRDLARREQLGIPWREIIWALRRFEARGIVRGGRFVAAPTGEQYALPEAVDALRRIASSPLEGSVVRISAADPLNLTGILLPGPRVPALRGRHLLLVDGIPGEEPAGHGPVARHRPPSPSAARRGTIAG